MKLMAKRLSWSCLALLTGAPLGTLRAQAAPVAPVAGCVQEKDSYVCNLAVLKLALEHSRFIAVEAPRLDRVATRQLEQFVIELGKSPSTTAHPAGLTFDLEPVASPGVIFGPSDHELASLRVTAPGEDGRPVLLWFETLRGQGDRPWPAQVHALLEQFQAHLAGNR